MLVVGYGVALLVSGGSKTLAKIVFHEMVKVFMSGKEIM
jgi:hypothetical protein